MKLSLALFTCPIRLDSGEYATEVLEAVADFTARVVHVGGTVVPFERVVALRKAQPEAQCPECGEFFANQQGLAGHRVQKHNVKGKQK